MNIHYSGTIAWLLYFLRLKLYEEMRNEKYEETYGKENPQGDEYKKNVSMDI